MAIIHVADIEHSIGDALTWRFDNGTLYDSITPMLGELFPQLKKEFDVTGVDQYDPDAYKSAKIGLYNAVSDKYLVIYYPVEEKRSTGTYQDEVGSYCSSGSNVVELSVPTFDIYGHLFSHFQHDLSYAQVEMLIEKHSKEYNYDMYYGDSVLYNCLILPSEETLDKLLGI